MSQPVYEMMVKVKHENLRIRLWIMVASPLDANKENIKAVKASCQEALEEIEDTIYAEKPNTFVYGQFAVALVKILTRPDHNYIINAVEVLNKKGNGGLYYPDWP